MTDSRWLSTLALAAIVVTSTTAAAQASKKSTGSTSPNYVDVVKHEAERRVDITVGGKPFTSYIWPTTLKKPVLWSRVATRSSRGPASASITRITPASGSTTAT